MKTLYKGENSCQADNTQVEALKKAGWSEKKAAKPVAKPAAKPVAKPAAKPAAKG